jgi:hypothetical protein
MANIYNDRYKDLQLTYIQIYDIIHIIYSIVITYSISFPEVS